jgi:hypothetical protein
MLVFDERVNHILEMREVEQRKGAKTEEKKERAKVKKAEKEKAKEKARHWQELDRRDRERIRDEERKEEKRRKGEIEGGEVNPEQQLDAEVIRKWMEKQQTLDLEIERLGEMVGGMLIEEPEIGGIIDEMEGEMGGWKSGSRERRRKQRKRRSLANRRGEWRNWKSGNSLRRHN